MSELENKLSKIYALLDQKHLDALYLQRVSSFAWATCGAASYINTATTTGEASLLITKNARYMITNNIEAPHYEHEEKLKEQGWQFEIHPWFTGYDPLQTLAKGLKVGADVCVPGTTDLSSEIAELRMNLTSEEQARFRELARLTADAMESAARAVRPGMTEYEIAGILAHEAFNREVLPIVNLIATDERIFNFRHPLPAPHKKMQKYGMLIICGRKYGLVCSVTRLVHFGPLSDELKMKQEKVLTIDATVLSKTRPGLTLEQMFANIQAAYASVGYPEEYRLHHQGGPAGYEAREFLGIPGAAAKVAVGQTYAWNPTITGTKVEDTVLITPDGFDVLTEMPNWPMVDIEVDGKRIRRPLILEM